MNDPVMVPCEESAPGAMPEIFQLIEGLQKRLAKFQAHTLKEARLTPPQYYILSQLAEQDGRPFKDLADALACTRATMTGLVDTLEKKKLVRRVSHPEDRRSVLVQLTDEGRSVLQSTPGLEEIFGSCCCNVLPPEETEALIRLLKKLAAALPF